MTNSKNYSSKTFLLTVILILGIFLLYSLKNFISAFLGSVIFYELSKKFMKKMTKERNWNKSLSAIIIIIISIIVILIPFSVIGSMLYSKVSQVIQNPQPIIHQVQSLDNLAKEKLKINIISEENLKAIPQYAAKFLGGVLNTGFTAFTDIMMMYFFLYFMLTNSEAMEKKLSLLLPLKKENTRLLGKELQAQTLSNALGIPLIAIAQGLCGFGAYWIADLPQAGFWGLLTGIGSIIPVVGAGIIWVPIVIYLFAQSMVWQAVTVGLICAIILGSIDNVIRFILAKKMADVHPVVTILGVIFGIDVFGMSGLIFGPLLISILLILIKIYYADYMNIDLSENKNDEEKNEDKSDNKTPKSRLFQFNLPFLKSK